MRNTKGSQTQKKRKNNKRTVKRVRHKKSKGGCPCNSSKGGTMKGGYGAASLQPFEHRGGQYVVPLNSYTSDPNMPDSVSSGRLSTSIMHGGKKRRSMRNKKMRGGNYLLGNTSPDLQSSFNTSIGGAVGANNLTGYSNPNTSVHSQPIGSKFGGNNVPLV